MPRIPLIALAAAYLPALLPGHGGNYTGPPDVVPPPAGGGGGRTGQPAGPGPVTPGGGGPGAPQPTGPTQPGSTGQPGRPGAPAPGGGRTTGGFQLTADLTQWDIWWEMNKNSYLRLREAVLTSPPATGSDDFHLGKRRGAARNLIAPTQEQIRGEILPALKRAIDATNQRDINSSCMVAMAKIGLDHTDFSLIDVFTPRLAESDQEIRETAALAIGIAAITGERELDTLVDLATDSAQGRTVSGGAVNDRTRAFALYGLGLCSRRTSSFAVKRRVLEVQRAVLCDDSVRNRNLKVAAILGMSLLELDANLAPENELLDEALVSLDTFYARDLGPGQQLIQAHCPTAIVRLIGRNHRKADLYKARFAAELDARNQRKRSSHDLARSCALALGQLVAPFDDDDDRAHPDNRYSKLLLETFHDHPDLQTRYFAVLGLGQIGGQHNRDALLVTFGKAKKALEQPWIALALGVLQHARLAKDPSVRDALLQDTLRKAFDASKEPGLRAALAVALGLSRTTDAAPALRGALLDEQHQEQLAGYLCIGLALMDDQEARPVIRTVIERSARRPVLLQQAAMALGKLGDKDATDLLQGMLTEGEPNLAKLAAVASSLGFIGDQRTVKPLIGLLFDERLGPLSRAFAAVALGGVADKEMLPWNSKIASNLNYRAAVETLTNQNSGILDIL